MHRIIVTNTNNLQSVKLASFSHRTLLNSHFFYDLYGVPNRHTPHPHTCCVCPCIVYKKSVVFTIGSGITPNNLQQTRVLVLLTADITTSVCTCNCFARLGFQPRPSWVPSCADMCHVPDDAIVWMVSVCLEQYIFISVCTSFHRLPCDPLTNAVFIIILKEIWYTPSGGTHVCVQPTLSASTFFCWCQARNASLLHVTHSE